MLQNLAYLQVADNSGAKKLLILSIPGESRRKYVSLGDVVSAVVKGAAPTGQVKDSQIVRAVIVRTKKQRRRSDGSYIRFDDNAAVIVDKAKGPLGTRVLGPIAKEVKLAGFDKVASLSKEVI